WVWVSPWQASRSRTLRGPPYRRSSVSERRTRSVRRTDSGISWETPVRSWSFREPITFSRGIWTVSKRQSGRFWNGCPKESRGLDRKRAFARDAQGFARPRPRLHRSVLPRRTRTSVVHRPGGALRPPARPLRDAPARRRAARLYRNACREWRRGE